MQEEAHVSLFLLVLKLWLFAYGSLSLSNMLTSPFKAEVCLVAKGYTPWYWFLLALNLLQRQ